MFSNQTYSNASGLPNAEALTIKSLEDAIQKFQGLDEPKNWILISPDGNTYVDTDPLKLCGHAIRWQQAQAGSLPIFNPG
jgi:hypothetical protein